MLRSKFLLGLAASSSLGLSAADAALPPFRELRELVRTNVVGITEQQLDQAAGNALLGLVHGRILAKDEVVNEESDAPAIAAKRRLEPGCLYVRAGQASLGLAPQLAAILADPALTTNALGLVLDLRFATGTEYAGAANAADLFASEAGPLLDWGTGRAGSTAKTNAWIRPVVVLVNGETRGAAEALAGILRVQRAALVIGSRTSGTAAVFRELPLADGRRLRMAASGVRTGDGQLLPSGGLVPDIQVSVAREQERAFLADPFATVAGPSGGTNRTASAPRPRPRINEAELVRARKAGEPEPDLDAPPAAAAPVPAANTLRDPALARAVDLLKGLSLMRPNPGP